MEAQSPDSNHMQHEPEEAWRAHAVCKGLTDIFYERNAERVESRLRREDKARRICQTCPVIQQCLEYSIENNEYGFWGGQSEEERYNINRKKRNYTRANYL